MIIIENKELSDKIDELIADLKKSLIQAPYNQRTFFDKVKNWWQNITKGSSNTSNPYYFQNKFGSLGSYSPDTRPIGLRPKTALDKDPDPVDSIKDDKEDEGYELGHSKNESRISLKDYSFLKENVSILSENISSIYINEDNSNNIKNLEIFRIIDDWGVKFKNEIFKLMGKDTNPQQSKQQNRSQDKEDLEPTAGTSFEFSVWIKNEQNMQRFIDIVNRIYSSPQYGRPLSVVVNTLEDKKIIHTGRTGLSLAVRNKIISIIRREILQGKKENSIFSPSVWKKYEKTAMKKLGEENKEKEKETDVESEEETLSQSDFADEGGSGLPF